MKISELIYVLENILRAEGDVEVELPNGQPVKGVFAVGPRKEDVRALTKEHTHEYRTGARL